MGLFSFLSPNKSSKSSSTSTTTNVLEDATAGFELESSLGINTSGGINAPITITQPKAEQTALAELYSASELGQNIVNSSQNVFGDAADMFGESMYYSSRNLSDSMDRAGDIFGDSLYFSSSNARNALDLTQQAMDAAASTTQMATNFTQGVLLDASQRAAPNNLDIVKPLMIAGVLITAIMMLKFR